MFINLLEQIAHSAYSVMPSATPSSDRVRAARLIAHRGAHQGSITIENTLEAFNKAKELGCWGIELDVHLTADKVFVVNHDANLKRIWGHDKNIAQLTFKELHALEPKIPTLLEVVEAFAPSMHLFIELKTDCSADEAVLMQTLQGLIACEHYHLLTLDPTFFHSFTHIPKHAFLLVAVHNNIKKFYNLCMQENYGGVLGHYILLNNHYIQRLKKENKIFGVGLVDSKLCFNRQLNRGIDWIFTNHAKKVQVYLNKLLTTCPKT